MDNTEQNKKIIVGITHGDINGISYEIILKAFRDSRFYSNFTPVIYGSPKVAAYYKKVMDFHTINLNHVTNIADIDPDTINIIDCTSNKIKVEIGKSTEMAGEAAFRALEQAVGDIKNNQIDVLVTAPINKHNIQSEEFKFKGHTDYLKNNFNADDVAMFMIADDSRVAVLTEHIPIAQVAANITKERIVQKLKVLEKSLQKDFSIARPKIAVLGLNPHSGDIGLIGKEEIEIINPAIEQVNQEGMLVVGPYPADGFFGSYSHTKFDAVLAMYHDQGLIPFKVLANDGGVNFTAGLPIVRTSPAHGTAYNIAGRNLANPKSMRDAIYAAIDIYKKRKMFEEIKSLDKKNKAENE